MHDGGGWQLMAFSVVLMAVAVLWVIFGFKETLRRENRVPYPGCVHAPRARCVCTTQPCAVPCTVSPCFARLPPPDRRVKGLSLAAGKHPAVVSTNMPIPALHGAALTVVPRLRTGWCERRGWLVAVHFGTRVTNTFKHETGSAKQTRWRRSRLWRGTAPPRPWLWYSACNAALTLDTASG